MPNSGTLQACDYTEAIVPEDLYATLAIDAGTI